ncbi:MAG TPA: hypothetical protein VIJ68_01935 [Candidatus Saccharimonadales bacterium]
MQATLAEHPEPFWISDIDSTALSVETLDHLAQQVLSEQEAEDFRHVTDACMGGTGVGFHESFSLRVEVLRSKGVTREQVRQVGQELVKHTDTSLQRRKDRVAIIRNRFFAVSGGVEDLIMPSLVAVGADPSHVHANKLTYDRNGVISGFEDRLTALDDGKAQQVLALELDDFAIGVGDGNNDRLIREAGGVQHFVAYVAHKQHKSVMAGADSIAVSFAEPLLS